MDFRSSKAYIDLSTSMIVHPDTRSVLTVIRNYAVKQLHAPMFFIGLYNEAAGEVEFKIAYEDGRRIMLEPMIIERQRRPSLVSQVIMTRKPILWMNQADKQREIRRLNIQPVGKGKACHSCWIYPLEAEEELLGVISIQSPKSNAWNGSDLEHFKALVYLASMAIANARNQERNRKTQELFENIQMASGELISSLEPEVILDKIMNHAVSTMGAWRSNIILLDGGGKPTTGEAIGFPEKGVQKMARLNGISRWVTRTGLPRFFENIDLDTQGINPGMIRDGVRSALCLPFIYRGRIIGVMWGHYRQRMKFTQEIKDAWAVFTNQAALAYGNADFVSNLSRGQKIQESLIDSSFDAIIAIDSQKRIVEFNQQAEKLLGYEYREVEGKSVAMLYASITEAQRIDRQLRAAGQISNYAVTLKDRNSKRIPALLSARTIQEKPGERVAMQVGYLRDLQEIRLLEDKLKALMEAGQIIRRNLRLKDVYKWVIRTALHSFPFAMSCVIHLYDPEQNILYRMSEEGEIQTDNIKEAFVPGEGIAGWVFLNESSQVLTDASKDPRYKVIQLRGQSRQKSMMCALLLAGNRPIGTITMHNSKKADLFAEEDLKLLSAFADQVGMAINRAQIYEKIRREERERGLVKSISEKLHRQRSIKSILGLLSDAGRQLLEVEITVAHLVDEVTGEVVSYSAPEGYEITPPRRKTAGQPGLTDLILNRGKVIKINDVESDSRVNPKVKEKGIKSLIGFPLITDRGETIGSIFFDSIKKVTFNDSDINLISLLVAQSAMAIYNIMLRNRKQRQVEKLKLLSNFSKDMIRQLPTSTETRLHRLILRHLATILGAEGTSLFLVDGPGILEKKACWGHISDSFDIGRRFEIHNRKGGGLTGWIAYHRKVFRAHGDELRNHPAVGGKTNYHLRSGACSALLSIPLVLNTGGRNQLVGMLEAENKLNADGQVDDALGFTDEDLWIANIFVKTVLTTLEISSVYRRTKERLERHANSLGFLYGSGKEIIGGQIELSAILNNIARRAWTLTGETGVRASFADIFLVEGDRARFAAAYPPKEARLISKRIGSGIALKGQARMGIVGQAINSHQYQLVPRVDRDPNYIASHEQTRSELVVPIIFGKEVLGAINVEHTNEGAFSTEDVQDLELLGIQAAIAIWNARFFEQLEKRNRYLQMINQASRVISKGGVTNKKEVIDTILKEAVQLVQLSNNAHVTLAAFQLVLPGEKEIRLESVIPPSAAQRAKIGDVRRLKAEDGPIGIGGEAILKRRTVIADNVRENSNYVLINPATRSEIDVPLLDGNRRIGTISLESNQIASFDEGDQKALEALAELAVVALKNVDSYLDLQKIKGRVGSLTALAWLSQAASTWGHSIRSRAINISNLILIMRQDLEGQHLAPELVSYYHEKLDFMDRLAHEIFDNEISPPSGDPMESKIISINDLIEERVAQLRRKPKFSSLDISMDLCKNERATVSVNPDMVSHVFEILINNAADAMVNQPVRKLSISTRVVGESTEIHFIDTGKGISKEYQSNLFYLPKPTSSSSGMGMGLLLAQAIVESYQGEIGLTRSVPGETDFMIRFPTSP